MFFRVGWADGGVEFLEPSGVSWKGSRAVLREMDFVQPRLEVFVTNFVDVRVADNLFVVLCLCDINPVEHVQQALAFQGDQERIIDEVEEDICRFLGRGGNGKVVDLAFEDYSLPRNNPLVQTWFMRGRGEANFT